MEPHVALVERPIDIGALLRHVQDDGVGAVTLFVGTVRNAHQGRAVTGIDYEAYGAMAEDELRAIAGEAIGREPLLRIAIEHRIGTLVVGDTSVAIAAGHARRAAALDASRDVIEAIKTRVPIWKREHYAEGDWSWVDPTAETPLAAGAAHAPASGAGALHAGTPARA